MVAICGNKRIAIECDGERWHSGEAKILEDMERQFIAEVLKEKKGNLTLVAQQLDISRQTLYNKMRKYGL